MMNWISPIYAALYLLAGAGLGATYFALLLRSVRLHASKKAAARLIPLYILRFAAATAGFWLIAQQGALPLLLALLGFLVARIVAQRLMASV